jgi:cytochrome c oxidase cbb3-type subunit IV
VSPGTLSGIVTAVLIVLFVGVCIWAYSSRRRSQFEAASRVPLEENAAERRP